MARVTVQAIADQLGLSKFAVSRALSGHSGVSEATRAAVVDLANRLGYVPRPRPLPQTNIEIVYHDPETMQRELWVEVQAGAQLEGARRGINTAIRWTGDPHLVAALAAEADGMLLIGPHDEAVLAVIREAAIPCVRIGGELSPLEQVDAVGGADAEGAAMAAQYLLELGHKRFVYVQGRLGYPGRVTRLESFAKIIAETDGTELRDISFATDNAPDDFRAALMRMRAEGFTPTGFFCGNDSVAVTVLTELMRMGIRVPEDASVVGFADYAVASHTSPALTTIKVAYQQIGIAAVRLLLSRLGIGGPRNDLPPQRIGLVPQLIVRDSAGPAPD